MIVQLQMQKRFTLFQNSLQDKTGKTVCFDGERVQMQL